MEKVEFGDLKTAFEYKSNHELKKANFIFSIINHPFISSLAQSMVKVSLFLHLPVRWLIKKTVFDHFCGGESIQDSQKTVDILSKHHVRTILDYSVEGEVSEKGFERTKEEIKRIIDKAKVSPEIPFTVFKMTGMASFNLLKKVQSDEDLSRDEMEAFDKVLQRVDEVCAYAVSNQVPIMIDAEESWIQDPVDQISYDMMKKYNKDRAWVLNTYQMYRKDSLDHLMEASQEIISKGCFFGTKLVRGAYIEKERERAEKLGYDDPIHVNKEATDKCFNDGLKYCYENRDKITVVCGSHNEYSNQFLANLMDDGNVAHDDNRFWFAQLFGMSDNISFNLGKAGFNVAKYVPYGPVLSVMPYLLRRAEENTSVAGQRSRELQMIKQELNRRG